MDTVALGSLAAEFMEHVEGIYGADAKLGTIGLVVEITTQNSDGPGQVIEFACSDERRWVQVGLFHAAVKTAEFHAFVEPTQPDSE